MATKHEINLHPMQAVEAYAKGLDPDNLNALVLSYTRGPIPEGAFTLVPTLHGNRTYQEFGETGNTTPLYIDGVYGYALTHVNKEPLTIGVVSFDLNPIYSCEYGSGQLDARIYPRILQMQGCTKKGSDVPALKRRHRQISAVTANLGMEDVMVDLVTGFAKEQRYPAVGILPALLNPNSHRPGFNMDRMYRRYDQTALRHGFVSVNGIYTKELA